jgi:hypothetical protein
MEFLMTDASTVSYSAPGPGTVPVSAADLFDAGPMFAITKGAVADGVTPATAAIQAAIDEVHARGGGVVQLEAGSYNLGSSGLVLRSNVTLSGAATRYGGSTTKGTRLLFSGSTGAAIYGPLVLDAGVRDLSIECIASSGADITGMWLNGCWKGRFINVTVLGATPDKGTSIRLDTNPEESWGAQHNYFEGCETPDGVFLFQGATGNDGSTTNVVNTNRGLRYRIVNSQVTFINATAEGFIDGPGFDFSGASCDGVLVGCDIEGSGGGFPGIAIAAPAEVREIGTLWLGFYGPQRVTGAMASLRTYGGALEMQAPLVQDVPYEIVRMGDNNAYYARDFLVPTDTFGGQQAGYRVWESRRGTGTFAVDHDFRDDALIRKDIGVASTATLTLFTIPVPPYDGLTLEANVSGMQAGDGVYANSRRCVVCNNAGTLSLTQEAALVTGVNQQLSFVVSGVNVLVQVTPTTANSSTVKARCRITGSWTTYT